MNKTKGDDKSVRKGGAMSAILNFMFNFVIVCLFCYFAICGVVWNIELIGDYLFEKEEPRSHD